MNIQQSTKSIEDFDPNSLLDIDISDLETEMKKLSFHYFKVHAAFVKVCAEFDTAKEAVTIAESQVRLNLLMRNGKTAGHVLDAEVAVDPEVMDARQAVIALKKSKDMLAGLQRSMEFKREMLKGLSWTNAKNEAMA